MVVLYSVERDPTRRGVERLHPEQNHCKGDRVTRGNHKTWNFSSSLTENLEQVPEPQDLSIRLPEPSRSCQGPSKAYRARVSLMSLRIVVVTEVPKASVI